LLNKLNSINDKELDEVSLKCINQTIESMAEYTKKEFLSPVWNAFYVCFSFILKLAFIYLFILNFFKTERNRQ